jgi:hypothetical protein
VHFWSNQPPSPLQLLLNPLAKPALCWKLTILLGAIAKISQRQSFSKMQKSALGSGSNLEPRCKNLLNFFGCEAVGTFFSRLQMAEAFQQQVAFGLEQVGNRLHIRFSTVWG